MKVQSFLILVLSVTYLVVGCKTAKYEFVTNDDVDLENPSDLTGDTDPAPDPPPSNSAHEFYGENGFWIKVKPGTIELGEKVTFTGQCGHENQGTLSWEFGDGQSGEGSEIEYTYKEVGSYDIDAICTDPDGTTQSGNIKVFVLPPKDGGSDNDTPGQNPGQNPGGQAGCGSCCQQHSGWRC